jgi:hypothetical protein
LQRADVVVAVGTADLKGVHALIRLLWRLQAFGIAAERIVPVLNRAPRHPVARAELTRALRTLGFADDGDRAEHADTAGGTPVVAGPVFLPTVRRLDTLLRDGTRLPDTFARPLALAVAIAADATDPVADGGDAVPVRPGELGAFFDERAAS